MIIFKLDNLFLSLLAAVVSTLFGGLIWWCLNEMLPFVFILSPFFLLLSLPIGLPILLCWRFLGRGEAIWAAILATIFLLFILPANFALLLALQLLLPAAFVSTIADLRLVNRVDFLPLSTILSSLALIIAIATIILAAVFGNVPAIGQLLDSSIGEMVSILRSIHNIPAQQINQFEMLLRLDDHALIVRMFALYSFIIAAFNFYLASRLGKNRFPERRGRDYWPVGACTNPRLHIVLLIGATLLSLLPVGSTLQNCLDILSMVLLLSFTLSGLAAIHLMSYGKSWRPFLLTALYVSFLPLFASFILPFLGILASSTSLLKKYQKTPPPR